jgi:hypothetical protein
MLSMLPLYAGHSWEPTFSAFQTFLGWMHRQSVDVSVAVQSLADKLSLRTKISSRLNDIWSA